MADEPTDHDLLIRLDEKMNAIKTMLCNHLSHHFKANMVIAGATLSIMATLVVFIITKQ